MVLAKMIYGVRNAARMSQEQFAAMFGVSQQSVQKWESGESVPELAKLVKISKQFGVSLDALILGNDNRMVEEMKQTRCIKPQYENIHDWEFYSSNLLTEYAQACDEGLDISTYKELFSAAAMLPKNEIKDKLGDIIFEIVENAPQKEGYPYLEPSELEAIQSLTRSYDYTSSESHDIESGVLGAWVGRACGCLLGKTVEGIHSEELTAFLRETGNYPMSRYILHSDLNEDILNRYSYGFAHRCYADKVDGMPIDDDTNYTVLYQRLICDCGRDFTPFDVSRAWLGYQSKDAYCTAERVAFCNFVRGYAPPASASYKNPYREWIGAQIRADYFGYINPGEPRTAAEMAWRDGSVSHTKNGIYGEMFVAAMLAVAARTNDIRDIILGGIAEIPYTSRLYEAICSVVDGYESGIPSDECFARIHKRYDEHTGHGWCHTIPNAMIVAAALLYGGGDFGRSICMAVETGFDTDCNGATVGSVLGMANGYDAIPAYWRAPINDTLHTSVFGVGTIKLTDAARLTLEHIKNR